MKLPVFLTSLGIGVAFAVMLGVANGFGLTTTLAFTVSTCIAIQLVYLVFIVLMAASPRRRTSPTLSASADFVKSDFTLPKSNTSRDT